MLHSVHYVAPILSTKQSRCAAPVGALICFLVVSAAPSQAYTAGPPSPGDICATDDMAALGALETSLTPPKSVGSSEAGNFS